MVTCREFMADFGDYWEDEVAANAPSNGGSSIPLQDLSGGLGFYWQDHKNCDRERFIRPPGCSHQTNRGPDHGEDTAGSEILNRWTLQCEQTASGLLIDYGLSPQASG